MNEGSQKVQTSSYKIITGDVMYSMIISLTLLGIFNMKVVERINPKGSHNKENFF